MRFDATAQGIDRSEEPVKFTRRDSKIALFGLAVALASLIATTMFRIKNESLDWLFICGTQLCIGTHSFGPSVMVRRCGLSVYRSFKQYTEIPWDDIASATLAKTPLGVKYLSLRTHSNPSRNHRIPLDLKDQEGFNNYVKSHAPVGNVLRVWIEAVPPGDDPSVL